MRFDLIREEDRQPEQALPPVVYSSRPFWHHVLRHQIQHLQQSIADRLEFALFVAGNLDFRFSIFGANLFRRVPIAAIDGTLRFATVFRISRFRLQYLPNRPGEHLLSRVPHVGDCFDAFFLRSAREATLWPVKPSSSPFLKFKTFFWEKAKTQFSL